MLKREKLLTKSEYKNNVRELQNDLDDIYFKLMNSKEANAYQTQHLACEFENIALKMADNLDNIVKVDERARKKFKRRTRLMIGILIANISMIFISFPLAIAITLLGLYAIYEYNNELIQIYLSNEVINWENVPTNIKELVISILQNDLNTNENDIYNLITLANNKLDNLYDPKFLEPTPSKKVRTKK